MIRPGKKSKEQLRRLLELRRSAAATPVPSKRHYSRKNAKNEIRRERNDTEA